MLEKDIQKRILKYLRGTGWHAIKVSDRFRGGILDIYTLRNGVSIWIEVKTAIGTPSELQKKEIRDIRSHGGFAFIARSVEDVKKIIKEVEGCSKG